MALQSTFTLDKGDAKRLATVVKRLGAIEPEIEGAMLKEANNAVLRMKRAAPVDTGRLKRQVGYERTGNASIEFDSSAIDPTTGKDYAPEQEFGGRNFPAHPYFFKNIRSFRRKVLLRINDLVTKVLNRR